VVVFSTLPTDRVDMKLGLLVVLAVAVVLPSISESRTVSRCELREKLVKTIRLPRRLARFREEVVAIGGSD